MDKVSATCQGCQQRMKIPVSFDGKKVRCPNPQCGKVFRVELPKSKTRPKRLNEATNPSASKPRRSQSTRRPRQLSLLQKLRGSSFAWIGGTLVALICVLFVVDVMDNSHEIPLATTVAAAPPEEKQPERTFEKELQPFLTSYCGDCHNDDLREGELSLDAYRTTQDIADDRQAWESIYDMVRIGAMPPSDGLQPTQQERDAAVKFLHAELYEFDCEIVGRPGRVTARRLNKQEYNNTVRDLFDVQTDPARNFPSDDVGYGFDNIGDVLSISPLLMERYLDASEEVADAAIYVPADDNSQRVYQGDDFDVRGAGQLYGDGRLAMVSEATARVDVDIPLKGEYLLKIRAEADQAGDELAQLRLAIDREDVETFKIQKHRELEVFEYRWIADKGRHRISVSFINDFYDEKAKSRRKDRNVFLESVEFWGPTSIKQEDLPKIHREYLTVKPGPDLPLKRAAEMVLKPIVTKAFRRPARMEEVEKLTLLVELAVSRGESFERGIQVALQGILVSPQFLYLVEPEPAIGGMKTRELNDYELASRLSYFLWSSAPDDELLEVARRNQLKDPTVLEEQARRMLRDPKSDALIRNFAGQWLGLRKLDEHSLDESMFRQYSEELKQDMWTETEMFFGEIVRQDRGILDLLTARFTYVNEPLAQLYGIPDVKGRKFQRVSLEGLPRAGLLTQASILTLTSYPTRTSPVKRGEWVLENILGDEPPPAPPVVPAFEDTQEAHPDLPLRDQLELHRADPGCASCHKTMDAIGFGFENFDALGMWREFDGKHPIDSAGELPGGAKFSGPTELVEVLHQREVDFSRCLSEKMLTYALGRGLEYYDRCAVDELVERLEQNDHRFSELVLGIVNLDAFRRRGLGSEE